mmetsp:Transcript_29154/g.100569  ORF Transcript_29154/g.100569 Transcript_29154/m.100569 type:complete len:336 (+) Transcript_29154:74-1081(+)
MLMSPILTPDTRRETSSSRNRHKRIVLRRFELKLSDLVHHGSHRRRRLVGQRQDDVLEPRVRGEQMHLRAAVPQPAAVHHRRADPVVRPVQAALLGPVRDGEADDQDRRHDGGRLHRGLQRRPAQDAALRAHLPARGWPQRHAHRLRRALCGRHGRLCAVDRRPLGGAVPGPLRAAGDQRPHRRFDDAGGQHVARLGHRPVESCGERRVGGPRARFKRGFLGQKLRRRRRRRSALLLGDGGQRVGGAVWHLCLHCFCLRMLPPHVLEHLQRLRALSHGRGPDRRLLLRQPVPPLVDGLAQLRHGRVRGADARLAADEHGNEGRPHFDAHPHHRGY